MLLQGQVADAVSGSPMQSVTVAYDCSGGGMCNPVGQTNIDGKFNVVVPDDTTKDILFSFVGYKPVLINAGVLQETGLIAMNTNPQNLAEVTVIANKPATTGWTLVAAAVGIYLLANTKGHVKRKISGTGINEEMITKVAIAAGLYFFVARPILQKLNILPSSEQSATTAQQAAAIDSSLSDALKVAGPNYSDATFAGFADSIYTTINSLIFKGSTVTDILNQMMNDTDVYKLIKAYGVRQKCFAFGFGCVDQILPSAITDSLSGGEIAEVNSNYATKGLTFKF